MTNSEKSSDVIQRKKTSLKENLVLAAAFIAVCGAEWGIIHTMIEPSARQLRLYEAEDKALLAECRAERATRPYVLAP